jgi:peptidoglycan hydrolase CwlO-like protein
MFESVLYPSLSAFLASLITYVFSRKKQNAEVKASELDNVQKALSIYRELNEDLKAMIREQNVKIEQMSAHIDTLEKKIDLLVKENEKLKQLVKDHDAT